jgi:hypothetical protein
MLYGLAISPIAAVLALTASGGPPSKAAPSGLSSRFVCPEVLPNDAARQRALQTFYDAYGQAEPAATVSEAGLYRLVLLKTHRCKPTHPRVRVLTGGDARWSF